MSVRITRECGAHEHMGREGYVTRSGGEGVTVGERCRREGQRGQIDKVCLILATSSYI